MIGHVWLWYWRQAEGNVLAVPPCGIVTLAAAYVFRGPIGRRLVRWLVTHHEAELARRRGELERARHDNAVH